MGWQGGCVGFSSCPRLWRGALMARGRRRTGLKGPVESRGNIPVAHSSPAIKPFSTGICSWLSSSPKACCKHLYIQCPLQQAASLDSQVWTSGSNLLSAVWGLWRAGWRGDYTAQVVQLGGRLWNQPEATGKKRELLPSPVFWFSAALGKERLCHSSLGEPISSTTCPFSYIRCGCRMARAVLSWFS